MNNLKTENTRAIDNRPYKNTTHIVGDDAHIVPQNENNLKTEIGILSDCIKNENMSILLTNKGGSL